MTGDALHSLQLDVMRVKHILDTDGDRDRSDYREVLADCEARIAAADAAGMERAA